MRRSWRGWRRALWRCSACRRCLAPAGQRERPRKSPQPETLLHPENIPSAPHHAHIKMQAPARNIASPREAFQVLQAMLMLKCKHASPRSCREALLTAGRDGLLHVPEQSCVSHRTHAQLRVQSACDQLVSCGCRRLKPWRWCGSRKQQDARQFWALKGPWFRIPRGQLFCLLGPNGAGKTTTINCLTGVLPASGTLSSSKLFRPVSTALRSDFQLVTSYVDGFEDTV